MFDVFRRDLTVIHGRRGQYIKGIYTHVGMTVSHVIKASVQATDAEIMQTLPEGVRTKESYTLFTDSELSTADITVGKSADVVIIDGSRYQVIKVTKMSNLDFCTKHYEVVVVRENVDVN